MDLRIKLSSPGRPKHRRVVALTFAIKSQAVPKRRLSMKRDSANAASMLGFL